MGAQVCLMRGFELRVDARPVLVSQNAQRVLAFLALRDRPQRRTTVASALWTDSTEDRAAANLRTALWKLSDLRDRLVRSAGTYLSLCPDVDVDLSRLMQRTRRLQDSALDDGTGDAVVPADVAAHVGELSADLLPDWDEDWLVFERERLRQYRIHALETLCRRLVRSGRFGDAVDAGLSAVESEPLRESAQRVLIEAHLAEGNVSEARRQFDRYRTMLWDDMGLLPTVPLWTLVGVLRPE